jgi:hypothetical protein
MVLMQKSIYWSVWAFVFGLVGIAIAQETNLILNLGRLTTNSMAASQVISVENRTSKAIDRVRIECGFYAGTRLVGSGGASIRNLQPGAIGHDEAVALHASDADNAKCRIESVN